MKIQGFAKMTLLDYPGKVACTIFTSGCNFRCPFCHNASLVNVDSPEFINADEILNFLQKRKNLLDGVCISGGEPLLQPDIKDFIKEIKNLEFSVKLDTNGSNPYMLKELVEEKLVDFVAMDIKNAMYKYSVSMGIDNYDTSSIEESIDYIMSCGIDYEFRTTVVAEHHTVEDIAAAAKRIKGAKGYFLQNFVDSGDLLQDGLHAADIQTLNKMLNAAKEFVPVAQLRGV